MSTTTGPSTSARALSADDHQAVLNLYSRYNRAIDFGDAEGWAACFAPDGVFHTSALTATGTDELLAFANGFKERSEGRLRHHISNVYVEATDSGARGGSYLLMLKAATEEDPQTTIVTAAIYEDELSKHDGEWRFTRRNVGNR
jgi:uncharacterized protein (TIGR02246 family)